VGGTMCETQDAFCPNVSTNDEKQTKSTKCQVSIWNTRSQNSSWAYEVDKLNGETKWTDSIETEVQLLYDTHECFRLVETGEKIPEEYHQIPLIWVFAVKFDGRRRARCVAGGHVTPNLTDDLYAGVVNFENVRIAFLAAELFDLDIIAADVSSAFIQAFTSEKVFVKAGPEFGKNEGRYMIVVRALYGLKPSGAMWHRKLAENLRDMRFRPSKADYDLWMRQHQDLWEYVAVIVDNLLVFSKEPPTIIEPLKKVYQYGLKGVGTPGADMTYDTEFKCWTMSVKTYVKKSVTEYRNCIRSF
jgi:hypothetical protein